MSVLDSIGQGVGIAADVLNAGLQIENQQYQRGMQKEAWVREDTAVQRRVNDLRAAGLSPVLAAGSAAGSSGPISVSPPQFQGANAMRSVEYGQAKRQQAVTEAQLDLLKEQSDATNANSFLSRVTRDYLVKNASEGKEGDAKVYNLIQATLDKQMAEAKRTVLDTTIAGYNSLLAESQGMPVTEGALNSIGQGKLIDNALKNPSAAASPLANIIRTIAGVLK